MARSKVFIDHHVAQLWGIDRKLLNNKQRLLELSLKVAADLKLTVVKSFIHQFNPHGLSVVLVISESHFAIHTWPELGYMNVDVLSCSPTSNLEKLKDVLSKEFESKKIETKKINY